MKTLPRVIVSLTALLLTWNSNAYPTYATGHINNITFAGDLVLIRLDTAMPDNCAGTAYNWISIPAERKAIQAFVIALQARGGLPTQTVTIYTDPPPANGFCTVNQIDPAE